MTLFLGPTLEGVRRLDDDVLAELAEMLEQRPRRGHAVPLIFLEHLQEAHARDGHQLLALSRRVVHEARGLGRVVLDGLHAHRPLGRAPPLGQHLGHARPPLPARHQLGDFEDARPLDFLGRGQRRVGVAGHVLRLKRRQLVRVLLRLALGLRALGGSRLRLLRQLALGRWSSRSIARRVRGSCRHRRSSLSLSFARRAASASR